jgi:hypothetical protein
MLRSPCVVHCCGHPVWCMPSDMANSLHVPSIFRYGHLSALILSFAAGCWCARDPYHVRHDRAGAAGQVRIDWPHGWAAFYMSSVVSAAASSGCSAVLACVSCICLCASMAGGSHSALHVSANSFFTCLRCALLLHGNLCRTRMLVDCSCCSAALAAVLPSSMASLQTQPPTEVKGVAVAVPPTIACSACHVSAV